MPRADELARVVKEVQSEINERAGHGVVALRQMLLIQMPAPRPHDEHGGLAVQPVHLALGTHELDRAAHRIEEVLLAGDEVLPGRGRASPRNPP